MWPTVTDVAWSLTLSVCLLAMTMNPAKMDEPIQVPCGFWTGGAQKPCIRCGPYPHRKGHFMGHVWHVLGRYPGIREIVLPTVS